MVSGQNWNHFFVKSQNWEQAIERMKERMGTDRAARPRLFVFRIATQQKVETDIIDIS